MTDTEILELAESNVENFVTWRRFARSSHMRWVDAINAEIQDNWEDLFNREPSLDDSDEMTLEEAFPSR